MGRLYDAYIQVGPRFAGLSDVQKEGKKAGEQYGRALAEAAAKAAQANVRRLGEALAKARSGEADAAGKVRVAEAKLNEVRADSTAKASQLAAAEESLAAAQRKSATAADTATTAAQSLDKARDQVAKSADGVGAKTGNRFSDAFKRVISKRAEKDGSDISTRFGVGFNGAFGGIVSRSAGLFVAGFAAVQGAQIFKGFINDARESEKISRITANAIRATGGAAKISAGQVGDLATAISNKTGIDDEQVQTAANMLLTFKNIRNEAGKNNDVFNQATQAAADLSVQFGGIDGASKQLGKALNDPIKGTTALAKAGVTFTDQQKKQIATLVKSGDTLGAQKIILKEIQGQVGGAAAAAADPMARLTVIGGNLAEKFGGVLLPTVNRFAGFLADKAAPALGSLLEKAEAFTQSKGFQNFLTGVESGAKSAFGFFRDEVLPRLKEFAEFITDRVAPAVAGFAGNLVDSLGPAVKDVFGFFKDEILPRLKEFGDFLGESVLPKLGELAESFSKNKDFLVPFVATILAIVAALKIWAVVQGILNVVLAANPIGLLVVGLAALVGGLVWAYRNSDQFRKVVDTAFRVVRAAAEFMWDKYLKPMFAAFVLVLKGVWESAQNFAKITSAAWGAIKEPARIAIKFVVDTFLGMVETVLTGASKAFGWVPGLGDKLKGASEAFGKFRDDVNKKLSGISDQAVNIEVKYSSKGVNLTNPSGVSRTTGMADGGGVFGGKRGKDSVPALLMPDEHVWTTRETAAVGGHGAMYRLRKAALQGKLRGFAQGGSARFDVRGDFADTGVLATSVKSTVNTMATAVAKQLAKTFVATGAPGGVQSFRGQKLNTRTIQMLARAEQILGRIFHITQGSYSTRVAASGSTHAGGGAMDTNGPGGWGKSVAALRAAGFAAWHRTPAQGPWGHHIHSIAIGDSSASPAAKRQVQSYLRGGNGLGGMAIGGPVRKYDTGGPWPPGTFGYNGTGKTETVRTAEQEAAIGGPLNVRVFIGDQELRGMVRVEVDDKFRDDANSFGF